ncbi:MAG: rhodanese-like domain-containing protein [Candidatus Moranbacteria bacterium]|nr:rhodanese-like domain-containing protein [Candidatus Moranbacteria bacterium]
MQNISVHTFEEILKAEKNNPTVDFINVCTPAEYKEKHIPGVRSVPLDEITHHRSEFESKKTIYVHCRSGKRSQMAIQKLQDLNLEAELVNVEGGIMAWEGAGLVTGKLTARMPIMQQVLLVAGILVLIGTLGALYVHKAFIFIALFVGAGLTFAGATGWCGMAALLAKMPWNK